MIDVPVRVKDALRSGDYRKNYRINADLGSYNHKYESPEITIYASGYVWTFDPVTIELGDNCQYVLIVVDNPEAQLIWDGFTIMVPEWYMYDGEKTYITVTYYTDPWGTTLGPSKGDHTIQIRCSRVSTSPDFSYADVTNQYGVDLDNTTLIAESVKFDERMCSDSELRFGLCEGTSVEFQYFDKSSILGARINIELDVEYVDSVAVGWDGIQSYSVNGSGVSDAITVNESRQYKIYVNVSNAYSSAEVSVDGGLPWLMDRVSTDTETYFTIDMEPGHTYVVTFNNRRGSWSSITLAKVRKESVVNWHTIPMGQFDVAEISRQASTGIIKATAYNKLMSKYLDSKINADLIELLDAAPGHAMPMYQLLKLFTEGYSIDKPTGGEDIVDHSGYPNPGQATHYYLWGMPEATADTRVYNGYRIVVKDFSIKIPVKPQFNVSNYYKFVINTLADICTTIYSEYLDRNDSLYRLWCDEISGSISLRSYVAGSYQYSLYFGGYFEIIKSNETIKIPLNKARQIYDTDYINDVSDFWIHVPLDLSYYRLNEPAYTMDRNQQLAAYQDMSGYLDWSTQMEMWTQGRNLVSRMLVTDMICVFLQVSESPADQILISESQIAEISEDITLRDLQSAVYEVNCQYGKLDRSTDLFSGIELNNGGLQPRDGLYPADGLYPQGDSEGGYPSMYSKLWADEGNVRSFKYLIITYKAIETIDGESQEVEKTLQRTVNADGTDNYNMSDNWLFRNLIWTSQQVGAYADAMVAKMQNIRWFPFEMWCAGLPYLEAGDEIEITMNEGTYKSYVLRRTLNGIQNLQDEMINGTLDIF